MKGQAKRPKFIATRSRKILGENVRRKMEQRYPDEGDKFTALAESCGNSPSRSTINRIIDGEVGPSIDTITQLANALHCEPWELLVPPAGTQGKR